jgi:hypothetical protein
MRNIITAQNACGCSHWPLADEEVRGLLWHHAVTVPAVLANQLNTVQD